MIKLTNKQKQEIVDIYWGDFYAMNIIDYFCEICPKVVNKVRKAICKGYEITEKEWKRFMEDTNSFGIEGGDWVETISLDTMNELLEMFDIDPNKEYEEPSDFSDYRYYY